MTQSEEMANFVKRYSEYRVNREGPSEMRMSSERQCSSLEVAITAPHEVCLSRAGHLESLNPPNRHIRIVRRPNGFEVDGYASNSTPSRERISYSPAQGRCIARDRRGFEVDQQRATLAIDPTPQDGV
jgi:hypothetical protein